MSKPKLCIKSGCKTKPSFNTRGEHVGLFCNKHKSVNMINVVSKRCRHPNCDVIHPMFNEPGKSAGLYCSNHKKPGMVDVLSKHCIEPKCVKKPVFNEPKKTVGLYCSDHKKSGMVDVKNKRCKEPNCTTIPVFNKPGELAGLYCSVHKKKGMVDVKNRRCKEPNCLKRPMHNEPGEHVGLYCSKHKKDNMIDIETKRCKELECNKCPIFNKPGEIVGLYCSKHKKSGMVDVVHEHCKEPKCYKRSYFNEPGKHVGLYCSDHKKQDMIDVVHKCCDIPECNTRVYYGYLNNSATRCAKHKLSGMITSPKKKCIVCKNKARYMTDDKSFFCESHKPKMAKEFGDVCIICCVDVKHGETKCQPCIEYEKRGCTLKRGLKEQTIKTLLDKESDLSDYSHDTTIPNGCLNRRPDFRFQRAFNTVILEVDEDQHRQYNCSCETSRMKNIHHANGESNMTFIRYNPDKYKPSYGSEWIPARRHDLLKKILREECGATEEKPHGIKVIYLFYNGFSELDLHVDWINPYLIE